MYGLKIGVVCFFTFIAFGITYSSNVENDTPLTDGQKTIIRGIAEIAKPRANFEHGVVLLVLPCGDGTVCVNKHCCKYDGDDKSYCCENGKLCSNDDKKICKPEQPPTVPPRTTSTPTPTPTPTKMQTTSTPAKVQTTSTPSTTPTADALRVVSKQYTLTVIFLIFYCMSKLIS